MVTSATKWRSSLVGAVILLFTVTIAQVIWTPYTKIEENFLVDLLHDLIAFGVPQSVKDRQRFNYVQFPDPVPHSFVAVRALATATGLLASFASRTGLLRDSSDVQRIARIALGSHNTFAVIWFSQLAHELPHIRSQALPMQVFFLLIQAIQFNFTFWMSRTTHNSMVLGNALIACTLIIGRSRWRGWDRLRPQLGVAILTFNAAILRSELAGLLVPCCLWLLITRKISLPNIVLTGAGTAFLSIAACNSSDRFFWAGIHTSTVLPPPAMLRSKVPFLLSAWNSLQASVFWPEWEAFIFNIVHGKSDDWGTMPKTWYMTSAIPKLLSATAIMLPIGAVVLLWSSTDHGAAAPPKAVSVNRHPRSNGSALAWGLLFIPGFHIALLSAVRHKEWRFIVYTVPFLNMVIARGMAFAWQQRFSSRLLRLALRVTVLAVFGLTAAHTLVGSLASHFNYPGGVALSRFHEVVTLEDASGGQTHPISVHIPVEATMTGATRFQNLFMARDGPLTASIPLFPKQLQRGWRYDRREDWTARELIASDLTHAISPFADCSLQLVSPASSDANSETVRIFQPIPHAPVIQTFQRVWLRRPKELVSSLQRFLSTSTRNKQLIAELMPIEIVLSDALWLCERRPE